MGEGATPAREDERARRHFRSGSALQVASATSASNGTGAKARRLSGLGLVNTGVRHVLGPYGRVEKPREGLSKERAFLDGDPFLAGTGPIECGRCWLLAFGSSARHRQGLVTIDEETHVIRRFQSAMVIDDPEGGRMAAETLIAYEPELDVADEASLLRELDQRPW